MRRIAIASAWLVVYFAVTPPAPFAATPVQVTTTGGRAPTASRDGNWVAYVEPGTGLMKISTSGGSPTFLVAGNEPNWERPGNLIVGRSGNALFTVDATTLATQIVFNAGGIDDDPAWSPLGNEIAVQSSATSIAIVAYPAGTLSTIPCSDPDATSCEGEGPTWSPDGLNLAFEDGLDLLKVARAGGSAELVLHWDADLSHPAWSPDGAWIAVSMGNSAPADSLVESHIWVVDARGSSHGLSQLTSGPVQDYNPAWSPDGNTIYFDSSRSGVDEIWKVTLDPLPVKPMTWGDVKKLYRPKQR